MPRSWRICSLVAKIAISISAATISLQPHAAAQQASTGRHDSSDYGAGGHRDTSTDQAGGMPQGAVYDPQGNLRQEEKDHFTTENGIKRKTEKEIWDFDPKYHLNLSVDYKYNVDGGIKSEDVTHYGPRGERIWEETTEYKPNGYLTKDWKLGHWTSNFTAYKFPAGQPSTPPSVSLAPIDTHVGLLFPRDFRTGDKLVGSFWPSGYAEGFKGVPGLSEYSFNVPLYRLPDGSPEWSGLEVGVKGDGYFPVNPNGRFEVHLPPDWTGPLQLQARPVDPIPGFPYLSVPLDAGSPVAAPSFPQDQRSSFGQKWLENERRDDLEDLWNEAYDLEEDLDEAYAQPNPDWEAIDNMEDDLDDCYDEIDDVISLLPKQAVQDLAHALANEAKSFVDSANNVNLTQEEKEEVKDATGWADFLQNEAEQNSYIVQLSDAGQETPYWTSQILNQDKLGALRGQFGGDPFAIGLRYSCKPIVPLASTGREVYFMPPAGLTPGLNNYQIDSPGISETILPVFYMTLSMSADQLHLHKGQSTMYHVTLDGVNGLSGSAWSSPFFPGDLVSPSELPAGQSPASIRTGLITLTVTNQSTGTITMTDQFRELDAQSFAPSGSYKIDGPLTAVRDGNFSITGVARAYLTPVAGIGSTPWPPTPSTPYPPLNFSYKPTLGYSYLPPGGQSPVINCGDESTETPPASTAPPDSAPPSSKTNAGGNPPAGGTTVKPADNPAASGLPATREAAQELVKEAKKKLGNAKRNIESARSDAKSAWFYMSSHLAMAWDGYKDWQNDWQMAKLRLKDAEEAVRKANQNLAEHPGIDAANALGLAGAERAEAQKEQQKTRQRLIDEASDFDKSKLGNAEDEVRQAEAEQAAAEQELRAAEAALSKFPLPPVQPPPAQK
ncbi:MAG: hypothetical protein ABR956_11765 [Terracidiphilus sp.]|jgi:hypothetical protein